MSFALLSLYFMAGSLALFIVALRVRRIRLRTVLPTLSISLVVILLLTAIFDNVMIASGLFDYGNQTLLGIHLGLAPLEDFTYPVCVVLFAPALWWLTGGVIPPEATEPGSRPGVTPGSSTKGR